MPNAAPIDIPAAGAALTEGVYRMQRYARREDVPEGALVVDADGQLLRAGAWINGSTRIWHCWSHTYVADYAVAEPVNVIAVQDGLTWQPVP